jgi:hypothetical protein
LGRCLKLPASARTKELCREESLAAARERDEQIQTLSVLPVSGSFFVAGYRYRPIATVGFAILLALVGLYLGLQIYFMPVKAKLENIAKFKARHGIPLDQPHKVDRILKAGYFRVP